MMRPSQATLQRLLGAGFGAAVIVGGSIGAGILRTPGEVAAHLREPWLILLVWAMGGIYALVAALNVNALAASHPETGGFYVFVRRAFGDGAGFTIGWCDWLGQLAAIAFAAVTMGEYAATLAPSLAGFEQPAAWCAIAALTAIQWIGLKAGARTQEWTSAVKAGAFVSLAAACFLAAPQHVQVDQATRTLPLAAGLLLSAQAVLYAYDGWYSAIYFAEEQRDPARNLPTAALAGVGSVAAIYLLINAALLYALPLPVMAASKLPAADAAGRIFGPSGGAWITGLALLSLPPLINAALLMATRILFALGRSGQLSAGLAAVSRSGTPRRALLLSAAGAILLAASKGAPRLLAIAGLFYVINYASAFACVIRLKPLGVWGYPYSTAVLLAVSLAFLAGTAIASPADGLFALAVLAASAPVQRLMRR